MLYTRTPTIRSRAALAALFAIGMLTASCTVTERRVAQQSGRIDDLQEQILRLERALDEGHNAAPPAGTDPQLARRLADLGQQMEELAAHLRTVQGRLDSVERRPAAAPPPTSGLDQLEKDLRNLTDRVTTLESAKASAPLPPPAQAPQTPSSRLSGQQLYEQGYNLYKQARYDDARQIFRQYVTEYPDAKLADNALFWIGECYYDQAQYEQAILEYDKVIQQFPRGDKVPSALLKQAFAFDAIGDPTDAKILLRKVVREHPDSEQAGIAKRKLEILGE